MPKRIPSWAGLMAGTLLLSACSSKRLDEEQVKTRAGDLETGRMVERLAGLAREAEQSNPFEFTGQIRTAEAMLSGSLALSERLNVLSDIAFMKNTAGDPRGALEAVRSANQLLKELPAPAAPEFLAQLRYAELTSYLRIGELENCLARHNRDCCLFPIKDGGLHTQRDGFQMAEKVILEDLKIHPDSPALRWLLTVVSMGLGKYPQGCDPNLVIAPKVFESEQPFPRFEECATELGIVVDENAGGAILDDFNNDGLLDIFLSSWSKSGQLRFFINQGGGRFQDRTREAGLIGITGGLNIAQTDYDNDGFLDVYVARGAWLDKQGLDPDSLLHNNGDGTFSDRTESSGLLSRKPNLAFVWADFNNDGWLDLFVGCESMSDTAYPAELFLNQRNGGFVECAAASRVNVTGFIRGVAAGDYDNDGWTDLYVSILGQPNLLFRNQGLATPDGRGWLFADVSQTAGVAGPLFSFPCWFWDYDNDGWQDLFVTGYARNYNPETLGELVKDMTGQPCSVEKPRLYKNNHDGTFSDVTQAAGIQHVVYAMGANFGDLDNDGFLDFYAGTGDPNLTTLIPNRMYHNDQGKRFYDVTTNGGFGHLQKGHGVAFGDFDNDGDQDILINLGGAAKGDNFLDAVFRNPGFEKKWISVALRGKQTNRAAIGTKVKVTIDESGRDRSIYRVVGPGGSFGASTLRLELGLGDASSIREVEIQWPVSKRTERFTQVAMNTRYTCVEGEGALRPDHPE